MPAAQIQKPATPRARSASDRGTLRKLGRSLWADRSGAAMVEYVVLLGVVSIAVAAAIVGLGPLLLAGYERAKGILIAPFP